MIGRHPVQRAQRRIGPDLRLLDRADRLDDGRIGRGDPVDLGGQVRIGRGDRLDYLDCTDDVGCRPPADRAGILRCVVTGHISIVGRLRAVGIGDFFPTDRRGNRLDLRRPAQPLDRQRQLGGRVANLDREILEEPVDRQRVAVGITDPERRDGAQRRDTVEHGVDGVSADQGTRLHPLGPCPLNDRHLAEVVDFLAAIVGNAGGRAGLGHTQRHHAADQQRADRHRTRSGDRNRHRAAGQIGESQRTGRDRLRPVIAVRLHPDGNAGHVEQR